MLDIVDGIKITVYKLEHPPAHIHAIYNEYEVLIEIESSAVYAGEMPKPQLRKVIKWLSIRENRNGALKVFMTLNPHLYKQRVNKKTK